MSIFKGIQPSQPRRSILKNLLLGAAFATFFAGTAEAGTVSLNSEVRLDRNVLTVGDIFSGVPAPHAEHVLAPAPQPGKNLVLGAGELKRVATAFDLDWTARPTDQSVIRASGAVIDHYDIEALVADRLTEELKGQRFEVRLNDRSLTLPINAKDLTSVSLAKLSHDLANNSFRAVIVAGDIKREVAGQLTPLTSVPVLSRAMNNGEVVTVDDIQYIDLRPSDLSAGTIVDPASLIGQTPRRLVQAMRPVAKTDVVLPPAVRKGETVTMVLKSGSLQLTAQGRSLSTAAVGDVVKVVNTASQQTIEAVVTADRTVTIGAPESALALDAKFEKTAKNAARL